MNPLLRLLLGAGKLPDDLRSELTAEGPLLLEEGLAGSMTRRHYRDQRTRSSYEKRAVSGSVAVTARRLVVWAGRYKHIDIPLGHPMLAQIEIKAEEPGRIMFGYDAGISNPNRSGRVEVRLHTPNAARIAELAAATPDEVP